MGGGHAIDIGKNLANGKYWIYNPFQKFPGKMEFNFDDFFSALLYGLDFKEEQPEKIYAT